MTLLDVAFDAESIDVDTIVPFADADAQVSLEVLQARRAVGELLFAREEDIAVAEIFDVEAAEKDERASDEKFTDLQRQKFTAEARRNRVLAERSRFRSRHRELEILSHLKREVQ
jgi:hypothetical protein